MSLATDSVKSAAPIARLVAGDECPACRAGKMHVFYEAPRVPANSCILFDTEAAARACPMSSIRLAHCRTCGFLFNVAFDEQRTEYSSRYEETQAFSGTFNQFHHALAKSLVERYELYGKDVLEIGCGKGEFLLLLSQLGGNNCIGIDPGVHAQRLSGPGSERVRGIPDFYSEKYGSHHVDFLACKMTLEHIAEPKRFVATVRRGLGEQTGAVVFFQIPESLRILRECSFEDIYHEHCAYFTPGSVARLFRSCGFDVLRLEVEYADQYLTVEARPRPPAAAPMAPLAIEHDLDATAALVATFPARMTEKIGYWRQVLAEARRGGRKVALWGSGSKAVTFLSVIDRERTVELVTDVNPYRHGHYMPGTGQRIASPRELAESAPGLVIAMNRIYETEIRSDLASMGLSPELRCL